LSRVDFPADGLPIIDIEAHFFMTAFYRFNSFLHSGVYIPLNIIAFLRLSQYTFNHNTLCNRQQSGEEIDEIHGR
ncbi:MAG: hypothetical protein K8R46_08850, partial [Pirellulales bacterium]|nr:hypothetical protein [Pirellulales bacterium]